VVFGLENIDLRFKDRKILNSVTFSIELNQIAVITGPNGSGKTTLLKLVRGIHAEDSGSIKICDKVVSPDGRLQSSQMAYLSADMGFGFNNLSLKENFYALMSGRGYSTDFYQDNWSKFVDQLMLQKIQETKFAKCSLGERQMMRLCVQLCDINKEIYLMDEPFTHLDAYRVSQLAQRIEAMANNGKRFMIALQDHQLNMIHYNFKFNFA